MTKRVENIQRKFVALCYSGYLQHRPTHTPLPFPANSTNDYSDWQPLHDRTQQSDTVFAPNFGGLWILYIFQWHHWSWTWRPEPPRVSFVSGQSWCAIAAHSFCGDSDVFRKRSVTLRLAIIFLGLHHKVSWRIT